MQHEVEDVERLDLGGQVVFVQRFDDDSSVRDHLTHLAQTLADQLQLLPQHQRDEAFHDNLK